LALLVLPDAREDVVDLQVGGLDGLPQPVHSATHLGEFAIDGLKSLALLPRDAVHLFIYESYEAANVALSEDVLSSHRLFKVFSTPSQEAATDVLADRG